MNPAGALLASAPWALRFGLGLPILAGLAGTIAPAFRGDGFARLFEWQGVGCALRLSVGTGLGSTVIALMITILIIAALSGTRSFAALRRALSPLLALPHAAAALGLAFLIAPSGWLVRLFSPWATGWDAPPDLHLLNDPSGLALTLGLVAKEVPFLLLMALAALPQCDAGRRGLLAASLGYGRVWGFLLTTLPPLYTQLRLPAFAVLTYAMTSVEMAMILGPGLPPTLAVQIAEWMADASLRHLSTAAAGALVQALLVGLVLGLWILAERLIARGIPALAARGWRGAAADVFLCPAAQVLGFALVFVLAAGIAGLGLWSVAGLWPFPAAFPENLTWATWSRALSGLGELTMTTLIIAVLATLAALFLVLASLEATKRTPAPDRSLWLIYLPLLVPQIAFLPGLQVLALGLGAKGSLGIVALCHMVFVVPYVFLSLAPAYRAWDGRIGLAAATLGVGPGVIFWRLRLPMLLAPLLTAFAVGMAVSIGQYLPTLMIGGGRVETLTTEAVALASGGNRRLIGVTALVQSALPALGFAVALVVPRLVYANRRAMLAEVRRS